MMMLNHKGARTMMFSSQYQINHSGIMVCIVPLHQYPKCLVASAWMHIRHGRTGTITNSSSGLYMQWANIILTCTSFHTPFFPLILRIRLSTGSNRSIAMGITSYCTISPRGLWQSLVRIHKRGIQHLKAFFNRGAVMVCESLIVSTVKIHHHLDIICFIQRMWRTKATKTLLLAKFPSPFR